MNIFFTSNLQYGAVTSFDSDVHPGVQYVKENFCIAGPNDWEGIKNKRNGWSAPWGGYFEWHWHYIPKASAGCLTLYPEANSEEIVGLAMVLPGTKPHAERKLLRSYGIPIAAVPLNKPLVFYVARPIQFVPEKGVKVGQHRLTAKRA